MSRFIYPLCSQNYCFSLSTCVKAQQNAWPGNRFVKCPDGYKCRRKFMGNEFRRISVYSEERDHFACGVQASGDWFKILAKESFEMPQPAAALSITNMMNPHLFFTISISFLLVAHALTCGQPVGCPRVPVKELFIIFVSVDLCWTKRTTGKSLCEMRMRYKFRRKCMYLGFG